MKLRSTIFLLLIAGGLFFYMRFYESRQLTTQEKEEQNRHVVNVDRDTIDGITITNNETKMELRKKNNVWEMEEPVKDLADEGAVAQLFTSIETLDKAETLPPETGKDNVRELGLVKPNITLQLLGQDAPPEILFGKDTAIEGKEYIRLGNSNEIYVVSNDLLNQVSKKTDDYRSHQLAGVAATQVTGVVINTQAGELALRKDHDHWEINKPIKARADDARVSDLVAQSLNARIDSFVPLDQAGAAATGLNDSQGSVTFAAEGADKPIVMHFSKPLEKDPAHVYAKLSTRDALFILPKATGQILSTKPNDVRDHHLIRINLDTVDRIHIQQAGAPEVLLARKGEDWVIKSRGDKAANAGDVQQMAASLQNQMVTAFVSDVASDLAKYGLDKPQLKVTFSSYASDNTAETAAGEEPLETVLFGKIDGGAVYAKLDDEPFIVSVPVNIMDAIPADPLRWQELGIFKLKAEEITAMDVTRDGQATLSFTNVKGEWKPAKGDIALNTGNIQSIANTLATLRAVQWAGAAKPAQGLDKPAETIVFTTAEKKQHTVKIGGAAGNYWYASAGGLDGTFEISRPDHDVLMGDVLPVAPPAPSASAEMPGK